MKFTLRASVLAGQGGLRISDFFCLQWFDPNVFKPDFGLVILQKDDTGTVGKIFDALKLAVFFTVC